MATFEKGSEGRPKDVRRDEKEEEGEEEEGEAFQDEFLENGREG